MHPEHDYEEERYAEALRQRARERAAEAMKWDTLGEDLREMMADAACGYLADFMQGQLSPQTLALRVQQTLTEAYETVIEAEDRAAAEEDRRHNEAD